MKRILPLLLGLLLVLTACKPSTNAGPDGPIGPSPSTTPTPSATVTATPTPPPEPTVTAAPAPQWGVLSDAVEQRHPDHADAVLVEGSFSLPNIDNAAGVSAYAAINSWYAKLMDGLKSDVAAEAAQALDDYEASTALGDAFAGYSTEQTYEITYETDKTVSILRTHYGFSSGPYPTLLYMADRFDLGTGAFLNFAGFFTDDAKAEEIIRAEVVRQGAEQTDYNQDAIASAFQRENFYLTADGFVFYYQPQILNSQAATKPEFLVPYALLEGLMSR